MEALKTKTIIAPATRLNSVEEYYFSKKLAEIAKLNQDGKSIINLGIGSPDLAPSQATIEALKSVSTQANAHGYQSYKGIPEFRSGLSSWMKNTFDVNVNPETEMLPLMGSKEGIMHVSMAFLNPGDEVLIPNPGYPTYSSVANLVGAKIRIYDLTEEGNYSIDFDALEATDLSKVKIMWLNYPHMPTGTNGSIALFEKLVAFALKHKILLVNDNPYSLILNEHPISIFNVPKAKDVAIELNSLSKSHNMAGWRIGWIAGNEAYIDTILKIKSNMDSGMFLGLQKAAVEALKNDQKWHNEQNAIYRERRKMATQILELLNCSYRKDQVGMFLWAKVPVNTNASDLVDKLLYQANVFITPGFIFGSNGEQNIRISLCSSVETLEKALNRIKTVVLS